MLSQLEYWHPCALRDVEDPNNSDFLGLYPTFPQFPSFMEGLGLTLAFLYMRYKKRPVVLTMTNGFFFFYSPEIGGGFPA
jgi:hypothetical protein